MYKIEFDAIYEIGDSEEHIDKSVKKISKLIFFFCRMLSNRQKSYETKNN